MSGSPGTILVGQTAIYTLNVVNLGPFRAAGVTVTNYLSANMSVVAVAAPSGVTYSSSQNVQIFYLGSMTNGQTASLKITVMGLSAGQAGTAAIVGDSLPDTNPGNNSAEVITTVNAPPPPISNLTVVPGVTGVFITWDTPSNSTAQVAYGLTTTTNVSFLNPTLTNHHAVMLTGLVPDTNYVFQARSVGRGPRHHERRLRHDFVADPGHDRRQLLGARVADQRHGGRHFWSQLQLRRGGGREPDGLEHLRPGLCGGGTV